MHDPTQQKQLEETLREAVEDNHLPCARAFQVAKELQVPVRTVGDACNQLGIRINRCQLGCFD
jgi:hypothetical protein